MPVLMFLIQSIIQSINQNTLLIPRGNCLVTVSPCKIRGEKKQKTKCISALVFKKKKKLFIN